MKNDDIINAVGNLDDSTIEEVNKTRKKNKSKKGVWIKVVAVAASVCLVISGAWLGFDFFGDVNMCFAVCFAATLLISGLFDKAMAEIDKRLFKPKKKPEAIKETVSV